MLSPYYAVFDKLNSKEYTHSIRVTLFLLEEKLNSFVNCNVEHILINYALSPYYALFDKLTDKKYTHSITN